MVRPYEDKMKHYYLIICLVSLIACEQLRANKDSSADFQQLLQETEALVVQTQTINGLWRDTQQLIKQAKELASTDKYTEAIAQLKEARSQAQLGYQQASEQAGKELVPMYLRP